MRKRHGSAQFSKPYLHLKVFSKVLMKCGAHKAVYSKTISGDLWYHLGYILSFDSLLYTTFNQMQDIEQE